MLPSNDVATVKFEKISLEEARNLLKRDEIFVSAVGHEGTAEILGNLLDRGVLFNRIAISLLDSNDILIVFQLKGRLPEGKILQEDEIKKLEYTFYKISLI